MNELNELVTKGLHERVNFVCTSQGAPHQLIWKATYKNYCGFGHTKTAAKEDCAKVIVAVFHDETEVEIKPKEKKNVEVKKLEQETPSLRFAYGFQPFAPNSTIGLYIDSVQCAMVYVPEEHTVYLFDNLQQLILYLVDVNKIKMYVNHSDLLPPYLYSKIEWYHEILTSTSFDPYPQTSHFDLLAMMSRLMYWAHVTALLFSTALSIVKDVV